MFGPWHTLLLPKKPNGWPSWDELMAGLHQDKWGKVFSEMMMNLLNDIADGKIEALSAFMEDEKSRVLHNVPMLHLPDVAPLQLD